MSKIHLALATMLFLPALSTAAVEQPKVITIAAKIYERDRQHGGERVIYQIVGQTADRKTMPYKDLKTETSPEPDTGGNNISLSKPVQAVTGLDAWFTPAVTGDGEVLLQYNFQVTSLDGWNVVKTKGAKIHLPMTTGNGVGGSALLKPGQSVNTRVGDYRAEISAVAM